MKHLNVVLLMGFLFLGCDTTGTKDEDDGTGINVEIAGRVFSAENGSPVASAKIFVKGVDDREDFAVEYTTYSSSNGTYRLSGSYSCGVHVSPTTLWLRIEAAGYKLVFIKQGYDTEDEAAVTTTNGGSYPMCESVQQNIDIPLKESWRLR